MKKGFTLLEVLIAFAILTTGLTLLAAEFSRHLAALQLLQTSVALQQLAEEQMIQETLRRDLNLETLGGESSLSIRPFSWDQGLLKGLVIDQATVEVSSTIRNRVQTVGLTSGFQQETK